MASIKRISAEKFMETLFRMAKEQGRLGEPFKYYDKDISVDYYSARNWSSPEQVLTNYEWDLVAAPNFGGNEGIYLDVSIFGRFKEDQKNREEFHMGTVKSLDTDIATMEAFGALGGNLAFNASILANGMLGRLSPQAEIEHDIERAEKAGKAKFYLVFPHDEDNRLTGERGYVLCYASERQWAEKWRQASIYKDFKAYMLSESEYKEAGFRLPWLDYVVVR